MRTPVAILSLLLCLSVGGNVWLWNTHFSREPHPASPQAPGKVSSSRVDVAASNPDTEQPEVSGAAPPNTNADLLTRLNHLLNTEQYQRLGQELTAQLREQPQNEQLLLLEAELVSRTQPLSDAVLHYYGLLELPLTQQTLHLVRDKIDNLTTTAIAQLRQDSAWDLLARFVEPLFQLLPDNKSYTLTLAEAYAQQQKTTLMEDVLAALPYDDPQAQAIRAKAYPAPQDSEAQQAPAQRQTASANETRLSLQRQGDQFIARVSIGERATTLLVDTGASTTAVSARVLEDIRQRQTVRFVGIFDVSTAAGTIQAPMVQVPRMELGPYRFTDVSLLVMPVNSLPHAEGLLGMNILKAFDFRIDQMNDELVLREH